MRHSDRDDFIVFLVGALIMLIMTVGVGFSNCCGVPWAILFILYLAYLASTFIIIVLGNWREW